MHSNIKTFVIHLPKSVESTSLQSFFNDIVTRMPNLTYLDIQTSISMNSFGSAAIQLFSSLPMLQHLTLPRFFFTSRIAECLSLLPKLRCIDYEYFDEQGTGNPKDIAVFRPRLLEGAFISLCDLSFIAAYMDVERFFSIPFSPPSLTTLYIDSPNMETPAAIHQALTAISESCQLLKTLTLKSRHHAADGSTTSSVSDDALQRISLETIRPIFACTNLTSLDITHRFPLDLKQDDLEVIATLCSSVETLNLNKEPLKFRSPELTCAALFPFAQHCPCLRYLGIFIDASPNAIPPSSLTSPFPLFKSLCSLSMGISKITEPTPVAMFLSQLLPLNCEINSGITWSHLHEYSQESQRVASKRSTFWATVNSLIPMLVGVRLEEQQRAKAMKMGGD